MKQGSRQTIIYGLLLFGLVHTAASSAAVGAQKFRCFFLVKKGKKDFQDLENIYFMLVLVGSRSLEFSPTCRDFFSPNLIVYYGLRSQVVSLTATVNFWKLFYSGNKFILIVVFRSLATHTRHRCDIAFNKKNLYEKLKSVHLLKTFYLCDRRDIFGSLESNQTLSFDVV